MSAWLKRTPACLFGLTLALLLAGSASAQSVTKNITTLTPTSCTTTAAGGGTGSGVISFSPSGQSSETCVNGETDIQVINPISLSSTSATAESYNCNVTVGVKLTDQATGANGTFTMVVNFAGTVSTGSASVTSPTTSTGFTVSPSTITLNCTTYSITSIFYAHAEPNCTVASGTCGSLSAIISCTPATPPTVSPSASPASICAGGSSTVCANASAGVGPPAGSSTFTSYSWSTGDTTSCITVSPSTTTTYSVTVTDSNGCQGSGHTTVTVNPNPTVTPSASPASICAGSSSTVCANAAGGSGTFTSYSWSTGDTTSCITVSPSTTTTYSVTVTDSNGCQGSGHTTVTVNPNPTCTVTATPSSITAGQSSTLCVNASGGSGTFTSFAWSTGDTTSCITVSPSTTTTYSVTVTDSNGCKSTGCSATVTVTAPPVCGRMTGGGSVFNNSSKSDMTYGGTVDNSGRVTHGFELHCCPNSGPNNLEVNWKDPQGKQHHFHLTTLTSATCCNNPAFSPLPPAAGFNTFTGTGTGTLDNSKTLATIQFTMTDAGQPGVNDFASFTITDSSGNVVLSVSGLLDNGAQQAHDGLGAPLCSGG